MLTLYLLRHAKTKIATREISDFDRALTARGTRDAATMGAQLRDLSVQPDLILCSQARRARETLAGIIGQLEGPCRVEIAKALYTFDAETLRRQVAGLGKGPEAVMVIGHNPALENLASGFAGAGDERALAHLRHKFPTGAFAELAFEAGDWRNLKLGAGTLVNFVTPSAD